MKKIAAFMLAFASFIFSASAQEQRKIKHHQHHRANGIKMKELTLTQSQIKASHDGYKKQLMELNKNEGITVKEAMDKKEALRKEHKDKMMALLTPEQKDKLIQLKKDRAVKHEAMAAKRLDKMKATLNLSDAQVAKIKAAKETTHAQLKAIKENEQLSRTEKKEQLMALKEQNKNSFKNILTPEQLSKMEEIKNMRMEKRQTK